MKIKNHEIIAEINRGPLTTVYKARHLNLDRPVLLKVLNQQWLGEKDLLIRFRREAKISARLQHKNIVNVYDFEVSEKLVYISLEYVEGQTLQRFIRENKPVPFSTVLSIFRDILNALAYAHKNGVVHRDIKPANVMLDDGLLARLTDFGLASFDDAVVVTEQGQSMGTPAYMAPEQIQGQPGTPQSDLFSLGVTVFEMLTGSNPFQGENIAATLQNVLSAKAPDIQMIRDDVPDWFVDVLKRLMAPNPENRPVDAGVVLSDLHLENPARQITKSSGSLIHKSTMVGFVVFLGVLITFIWLFWPQEKNIAQIQNGFMDTSVFSKKLNSAKIDTTKSSASKQINNQHAKVQKKLPIAKTNVAGNMEKKNHDPVVIKKEVIADARGYLFVSCSPWAKVVLDGDSVDMTPLQHRIELSAGVHVLRLENPNYKTHIQNIEVVAGKNDTINIDLDPAFGYLLVKVSPWARLFINGHYKEDTPLSVPLIVASGRNIIKLINPALGAITDTVYVKPGETVERHFTFSK